jgi:hypothetical protein
MADDKKTPTASPAQTVRLDPETIPDPPVATRRRPTAKVTGTETVTSADLDGDGQAATVELSGFDDEDGKPVTLRFEGVPATGGKVPQETLDGLLANAAVAWQRPEDRAAWVRDYGTRS